MESIRVLYVEDDPADQELARRHLERHAPHLKLRVAETVAEALDQLAVGDLDLVLADYRLPDGTGLDLLEAIKAREFRVPVVLITGAGDVGTAVRLLKAGAADYVVKRPGHLETLPPVLEGAFQWFRWTSKLRQAAIRVLYAEHDSMDVELTRRAFREHGPHLDLEVASRGREALERLRAVPYDVILLDYRMPDLSGIEILKALRDERIRVPVVMVTGQADEEIAVQAFKLGVADYVIKREGYLTKLPSTLENVLTQRHLADENEALLVLNGLTESIASLQDPNELARRVAQAATHLLKAEMSVFWLADGNELSPAGWFGIEDQVAQALRLRVDERLLERAAVGRRVAIPDLLAQAGHPTPLLGHAGRILGVSLMTAGRMIGVLAVLSGSPREFSATEEHLLIILSDHAATAVENARLYQQLKDRFGELQRTQAKLLQAQKVAAMGQLLAGVAHELNNPLSVVIGQSELLRADLEGGPFAEQAEMLTKAARRCVHIARNFLTLSRQHPPERSQIRLNQICQEAVELLAYPLRADDVEVRLDLAPDLPLLWADPHQVHQVIVNLVTNAHHAMRLTAPPRRLTLMTRYDQRKRQVSLEVADTGPGIPPEIQAHIFEPFFTTKPPGQGTGLGLSLCQGIIESHGGTIQVESQPGRGSVFRIELPVETAAQVVPGARSEEAPAPIQGKRILVVDDEPGIAHMLANLLRRDGHQVETAENGAVALHKLQGGAYDLILCDLRMPELDGPGLYRELGRRDPQLCRRIVFLTGDTLNPTVMEFLESTGAPSLSKPFNPADVRRVVQQVLRGLGADSGTPSPSA